MEHYVECDGEWARRQPVSLEHVRMYVFPLPAHQGVLDLLCDRRFNDRPTGGRVRVTPLLPAVLLVCADIGMAHSDDPEDAPKGWLTERDAGFFVPVSLEVDGASRVGALVPYLFVDNMAGVLGGREIYGFPKELGQIAFDPRSLAFEVQSLVLPVYSPRQRAVQRPVISVSAPGPDLRLPLPADVLQATGRIVEKIHEVLHLDAPAPAGTHPGFAEVPLLFLKQFRDAARAGEACYQGLVQANASIGTVRGGEILVGDFEVSLPPYASLRIAEVLGLARLVPLVQHFTAPVGFALDLDFRLPVGDVLWSVP
jgi:hypothetical protein